MKYLLFLDKKRAFVENNHTDVTDIYNVHILSLKLY